MRSIPRKNLSFFSKQKALQRSAFFVFGRDLTERRVAAREEAEQKN
jgi:hypothetical protein